MHKIKLFILFSLLAFSAGAANLTNSDGTVQKAYRIGNVVLNDTTASGAAAVSLDLQNLGQVTQAQVDSRFASMQTQVNARAFNSTVMYWLGNRDNATLNISEELNTKVSASELVGQVVAYAGQSIPQSYLECNGAEYLRSEHPALYAAIGSTYGGNGTTTFRVPDLRGEFVRGLDSGRGIDSGRALGSWQDSENKSHEHGIKSGVTAIQFASFSLASGSTARYVGIGGTAMGAVTSGGAESRPRNVAMRYLIRR